VLDIDGVLVRGSAPVPGAAEVVRELRRRGRVLYLTNNSTLTREAHATRLASLGIPAEAEQVLSSGFSAARYLSERGMDRVHVVGERGLIEELRGHGIEVSAEGGCDAVVVGLDRSFTYARLAEALVHLQAGAELVATNRDSTLVTEHGRVPGAGAIVAAVEAASGKKAVLAGKPSMLMGRLVLEKLGCAPEDALLIGDSISTDIAMGRALGMQTVLVQADRRGDAGGAEHVITSLRQLLELL